MTGLAPGDVVDAAWVDEDGLSCEGRAVIVATSRHKTTLTTDEAAEALARVDGGTPSIYRVARWNSVIATDRAFLADGITTWAEGAKGKAWVDVAYAAKSVD